MSGAVIVPKNDGSYHISGEFKILTESGKEIEVKSPEVWLCRCGQSATKPFCDGTHRKVGFKSPLDNPGTPTP